LYGLVILWVISKWSLPPLSVRPTRGSLFLHCENLLEFLEVNTRCVPLLELGSPGVSHSHTHPYAPTDYQNGHVNVPVSLWLQMLLLRVDLNCDYLLTLHMTLVLEWVQEESFIFSFPDTRMAKMMCMDLINIIFRIFEKTSKEKKIFHQIDILSSRVGYRFLLAYISCTNGFHCDTSIHTIFIHHLYPYPTYPTCPLFKTISTGLLVLFSYMV
jgi:hypothetical protein